MVLDMKTMCLAGLMVSTAALHATELPATISVDTCSCMDWRHAYNTYEGVNCQKDWPSDNSATSEDFCENFFYKVDGFCVKGGTGTGDDNLNWCFVSDNCEALNGGRKIQPGIARKICTADGKDRSLSQLTFPALQDLAHEKDMEITLTMKFAYDNPEGSDWGQSKNYFAGLPAAKSLKSDQLEKLDTMKKSGMATIIDSRNNMPPMGVVVGQDLYEVNFNHTYLDAQEALNGSVLEHPNRTTYVTKLDPDQMKRDNLDKLQQALESAQNMDEPDEDTPEMIKSLQDAIDAAKANVLGVRVEVRDAAKAF